MQVLCPIAQPVDVAFAVSVPPDDDAGNNGGESHRQCNLVANYPTFSRDVFASCGLDSPGAPPVGADPVLVRDWRVVSGHTLRAELAAANAWPDFCHLPIDTHHYVRFTLRSGVGAHVLAWTSPLLGTHEGRNAPALELPCLTANRERWDADYCLINCLSPPSARPVTGRLGTPGVLRWDLLWPRVRFPDLASAKHPSHIVRAVNEHPLAHNLAFDIACPPDNPAPRVYQGANGCTVVDETAKLLCHTTDVANHPVPTICGCFVREVALCGDVLMPLTLRRTHTGEPVVLTVADGEGSALHLRLYAPGDPAYPSACMRVDLRDRHVANGLLWVAAAPE